MTNSGRNLNTKKTRMYRYLTKETEPWAPTSFNWQVRMNVSDESQAARMMNAKASAWVLLLFLFCLISLRFTSVHPPPLSLASSCDRENELHQLNDVCAHLDPVTLRWMDGWMDGIQTSVKTVTIITYALPSLSSWPCLPSSHAGLLILTCIFIHNPHPS